MQYARTLTRLGPLPVPISTAQLCGLDESHLVFSQRFGCQLQPEVDAALGQLAERAAGAGIELKVASGYRSFARQLAIWEGKCSGRLAIMDRRGETALAHSQLDAAALVEAILRWSALPGASRHHWGTDVDIYDGAAIDGDYRLQLSAWEYSSEGPFGPLVAWLERALEGTPFYRPYGGGDGVGPEPWHLSYRPIAAGCERILTREALADVLSESEISHREVLLQRLPELYRRFIGY